MFAHPRPPPPQHTYEHSGSLYTRQYVSLSLHTGLKFRRTQPSFLTGDVDSSDSNSSDSDNEEAADSSSIFAKPPPDKWRYVFGGDVSLTTITTPAAIKTRGRGKQTKVLHPLMLHTCVDSTGRGGLGPQSSVVTFGTESAGEAARWSKAVGRTRDTLQYLLACRECNYVAPMPAMLEACGRGEFSTVRFEHVGMTTFGVASLAVFFKRRRHYLLTNPDGADAGDTVGQSVSSIIINHCAFDDSSRYAHPPFVHTCVCPPFVHTCVWPFAHTCVCPQ